MKDRTALEAEMRSRLIELVLRDFGLGAPGTWSSYRARFPGFETFITVHLAKLWLASSLETPEESSDAERRFLEILAEDEHGKEVDVDDFASGTSEAIVELRALVAEWQRLEEAGDEQSNRLEAACSSPWDAFLDQLRELGPSWRRYDLGELIAEGGMGAVRRVHDRIVRRDVAMKVVKESIHRAGDESGTPTENAVLGRFLEEAQVTGQLDHPNIVPVHELGLDESGQVYFTMKLVEGDDLRAVIEKGLRGEDGWSQSRIVGEVILKVCDAMAFAHEKGVLHRDLKPGNVMVGRFGEVYVMDWGLARVRGTDHAAGSRESDRPVMSDRQRLAEERPLSLVQTLDGDIVGTPAYMPPEQASGAVEQLGPTVDVYAVGAMLYHVLAGHMPYLRRGEQTDARAICKRVVAGPPPALAEEAPQAPAELVAICEKAMARDPGNRYPAMQALAEDLRAFVENRVVAAHAVGPWAELRKWIARNRALAATAAAAVLVITILTAWFVQARQVERDAAIKSAREAEELRLEAQEERDRVFRLSASRILAQLLVESDVLWPEGPGMVDAYDSWLTRAEELLAGSSGYEAALEEVRQTGTPNAPQPSDPTPAELESLIATCEAEIQEYQEHYQAHVEGKAPPTHSERCLEAIPTLLKETEQELEYARVLRAERHAGRWEMDYSFADDSDQLWHDTLRELVAGVRRLEEGGLIERIQERRRWASAVLERTVTGQPAAERWREARKAIQQHAGYNGLELTTQIGLIPIGPDPESGLWEFAFPRTGEVPERVQSTGKLILSAESSLVFVLIPGGIYTVGTQNDDPALAYFEEGQADTTPLQELKLGPFFLSKYEMTVGQWKRFTGRDPSYFTRSLPGGHQELCPVDSISWDVAMETMRQLGLMLPTEAQWEAACRAGTSTRWWFGDSAALPGYLHLRKPGEPWVPHPIGTLPANSFGLHEMHSNVSEWCRDHYSIYAYDFEARTGDGLRIPSVGPDRIHRGGSLAIKTSTSSYRDFENRQFADFTTGLRPARAVK